MFGDRPAGGAYSAPKRRSRILGHGQGSKGGRGEGDGRKGTKEGMGRRKTRERRGRRDDTSTSKFQDPPLAAAFCRGLRRCRNSIFQPLLAASEWHLLMTYPLLLWEIHTAWSLSQSKYILTLRRQTCCDAIKITGLLTLFDKVTFLHTQRKHPDDENYFLTGWVVKIMSFTFSGAARFLFRVGHSSLPSTFLPFSFPTSPFYFPLFFFTIPLSSAHWS